MQHISENPFAYHTNFVGRKRTLHASEDSVVGPSFMKAARVWLSVSIEASGIQGILKNLGLRRGGGCGYEAGEMGCVHPQSPQLFA